MDYVRIVADKAFMPLAQKVFDRLAVEDECIIVDIIEYHEKVDMINSVKYIELREYFSQLQNDDRIIQMDADVFINANPFGMFEESSADILLAERQYACRYPYNAGVVGFRVNPNTRRFLDFYCSQLINKTWNPYIDFQRSFGRTSRLAQWFDDQDLFIVCMNQYFLNSTPFEATMGEVSPKWNWTESHDTKNTKIASDRAFNEAVRNMMFKVGDKNYPVLHFKGGMKDVLREIWGLK